MTPIQQRVQCGGKEILLETGKIAKQADGAVWVRMGDSIVLVTVVSAKEKKEGIDFFPLTVDYQEKLFAAGKVPGSFFRREGRPTEKETLVSRIVDRSCRPLFPEGYSNETQIIASVVSFDQENDTDVLALTGASTALQISDVPFNGPIAGVRVARVGGQLVANPTLAQRASADLDIVMAASADAIVMVEGGAQEVSEAVMIDALLFGQAAVQDLLKAQQRLAEAKGAKAKRAFEPPKNDVELRAKVRSLTWEKVREAYGRNEKHDRYGRLSEIKKELLEALKAEASGDAAKLATLALREKEIKGYYEDVKYEYMRKMITDERRRIGGRGERDIRKITCEVGLLPRVHGSALFTRGETQALVATTLGTAEDEQRVEQLTGMIFKKFMLHYNFPPFSVGEVKFLRSPGRREIGHGALAERALRHVMPAEDKFPYTVRIVSDIMESNGSSSMASVCGGCLSLMDAGVPIKAPVAGIAMGLIKEGEKIAILSDILGDEDHLGDMDFKVCGTEAGITSIQMDIKIGGVTREILERALSQAAEGRKHILGEMLKSIQAPRADVSAYAPRITTIKIRPERIKDVIGPGGKVIKEITAQTGCAINIEDDGSISIASSDQERVAAAIKRIRDLTQEAEVGKTYLGTVRKIAEFGAFVEIFPGTDGLIHISELSDKRVKSVSDVLSEGEEVLVKVISVDRAGKIRLSRKEALADAAKKAEGAGGGSTQA
ncbi:polyribonucleotide nucleotidyltransferase [Anaeromyxobacter diazotrophicus]|uniref:Polyribonucleotide nucleotidyltransferase n=1 Tax=Anaeromyxobacter diazotrophicus TaxID=2590199 RepID=A0A7I9VU06_9BACT|nr:polyribonucleotide nucleotidyltransferase [Anaeromyxobacter diazotrophicus]GEJ59447.1 polyribonucleotide nucleotidyltransferase [Anaeromyxobacter diazotrophicus]